MVQIQDIDQSPHKRFLVLHVWPHHRHAQIHQEGHFLASDPVKQQWKPLLVIN
jgi:hypothetical protein